MRIFSQKTGGNQIKPLFTALKSNTGLFSVSSKILVFIFVCLVGYSGYSASAKISKQPTFTHQTTNIFPGHVTGNGWDNTNSLYSQDVSENAMFGDFNTAGSAYIGSNPSSGSVIVGARPESGEEMTPDVDNSYNGSSGGGGGGSSAPDVEQSVDSEQPVPETEEEVVDEIPSTPSEEPVESELVPELEVLLEDDSIEPESTIEPIQEEDSVAPAEEPADAEVVSEEVPEVEPEVEVAPEPEVVSEPEPEIVSEPDPDPEPVASATDPFKIASQIFAFAMAVVENITSPESSEVETVVEALPAEVLVEAPVLESIVSPDVEDSAVSTDTSFSPETQVESSCGSCKTHTIEFEDFGIPPLSGRQTISNLQLRFSMAAKLSDAAQQALEDKNHQINIEYSFDDTWHSSGDVYIDDEISNAINGGYFLYGLPTIRNTNKLKDLKVRFVYYGDETLLDAMYLDSLWVEMDTESLYREKFNETEFMNRVDQESIKNLLNPEFHTLLSNKLDFARGELPIFALRYNSQRNVVARAFSSFLATEPAAVREVKFKHEFLGDVNFEPAINMTTDGLWTIQLTDADKKKLRPGRYSMEIEVEENGSVYVDTIEFQWGLLTINPLQATYALGDTAEIHMGALEPSGDTLCEADLRLYIIDPDGFMEQSTVSQSGECFGNNVIDVPDYYAFYDPLITGEHELYLESLADNGDVLAHTNTTFWVDATPAYVIERSGPTRIYPLAEYPVELHVSAADNSFDGVLIEKVPKGFIITDTTADIDEKADYIELTWDVSVAASSTEFVSYTFDAPDISPYLYELGPAELVQDILVTDTITSVITSSTSATSTVTAEVHNNQSQTAFLEHRTWQIASDAPPNSPSSLEDTPAFDNYVATTSMPVIGGFAAYDPESDVVEYEFQIDDDYDFSSPATTTNSANYPSDAGWSAATFASGATTTYAIQVGDSLADGTYWWRVRARDPFESNTYNTYTAPRSITIDTSVTVSQWHQTDGLQFETGVLTDLSTTTGGVELTDLGGAPGDYVIRRNNADTTTVTTGGINAVWDTAVASSGKSISYSAGTYTLAAGKYLMLYSERVDTADTTNNDRVEVQSRLVIAGTATTTGAGQTFIRKNNTQQAGILGGASILDIPSDGTTLETQFNRTDTSGGAVTRTTGWGGVSILRLADDWDYARYSLASATTPPDGFNELAWTTTAEEETGFSRTGANITVADAGRYLVSYTVPIDTGGGTDRTEYVSKLQVDNADIEGTYVSTYIRESEGTEDGVLSYVGIVDIGAGEVLDVKVDMIDGTITGHNMEAGSSIELLKLPSGNQTIIAEATSGEMNPATVTEFAWDTTAFIDTGAFTMTAGTDSFMEVDTDGDYLFFASQQTTNGGVRTFPSARFSVNDVIEAHAAGGQYNRSSGADQAGYSFGALLTGLTAADDISLENLFIEVGQLTQTNNHGAMSGLQLDSVFSNRTSIMSPEIDHDWVPNQNTWGSVDWSVTEPAGSDTLLQVYYTSATACDTLIPDGDLSGNAVGFDALDTGLPISGLSTSTYNRICLKMTLNLDAAVSSPTLDDWTVSWALPNQAPLTPTLTDIPAFDNVQSTSTPTLGGFVTTDYEGEEIEYEISIDDDKLFGTPATTSLSSNYPSDTGWASSTYSSNATTTYVIQAADALSNGVTYWWRVRARDPLGSNSWSAYSEVRSITINTAAENREWHQTLGLQFENATLVNAATTTGAAEIAVLNNISVSTTTDDFEGLADANTTFAGTNIWKQAAVTTDVGDWQAETGATASNGTGPDAASSGSVFIFTEASNNQTCDNQGESTDCAIEADIADGTLDGIHFDYHMFGGSFGTLNLDLYNGTSWSNVWTRTGQQSVDELDWQDSGYLDLSGNKATTTILRFYGVGSGSSWDADFALDNIRIATSSAAAIGTVMSEEFDFTWVSGENTWGDVNWNVTEPAGSDTLLHVYYSNVGTCDTLIPDINLAGNAAGFDASESGFFIDSLSTTTYDRICLQMELNQGTSVTSPTLDDWTVRWALPDQTPYAPTLAELPAFDSIKATTTTPTLGGFAANDYEGDTMEFEVTLDTDYTFSSPDLTKTSSDFPGDAGWNATTFAASATTTYTVQPGDALSNGTTYFWRVRARDPLGSNTWGEYSEVRSVTISTAVGVPEWYETLDEQFVTDSSFINATTSGTGGVVIEDENPAVTFLDSWSTGSTKSVSAGTDRLLVVAVVSEDSGTSVNVNTVTYGGQTLTEIDDRQIGTGFSNGAWVGYLDEAGIASSSGTTITPTWTGGTPDNTIAYASAVFENVHQDTPLRGNSGNALTSGTTITPAASISVVEGDMMFYVSESATGLTHTAATGYTEGTEQDTGGNAFATANAYKSITADGSEYPEAIWSASGNRLLMVAVGLQPSPAVGSVMSAEVDFDWVVNQNDWGEVTWNVTEPDDSVVTLQMYYTAALACDTIIPDGDLPGNAAGFLSTDTPTDISGLSTSTYNRICILSSLDMGSSDTSPELTDWAISWELKPAFTQEAYHWYVNEDAITPTDTWPAGATASELTENGPIVAEYPTKTDDVLRLRMGIGVESTNANGNAFKLQYAEGETCTPVLDWTDVGPIGSTTALWRGYDNAGVADGATIPSALLAGTTDLESYEEENSSVALPNAFNIGEFAEHDWVLQNQAAAGTSYCFRMVNSDGVRFKTYSEYPQLVTNIAPTVVSIDTPFDNQKIETATPVFEFTGVDPEGEAMHYQIQVDEDINFGSADIDANSISQWSSFTNLDTFSDKSPFNDSETIRYTPGVSLVNGNTYWWRVRALDSGGSETYGDWTTVRSFTVDTSLTLTTWFQTTEEQFDTDILVGTDAIAGSDWVAFAVGSTTGSTTGSAIDFDDVVNGNAWGSFTASDTGADTDIVYHIEYYTGSVWALIPDGDLPGNATGFASTTSLLDLDTETYNQIRVQAEFTSGSPTLTDWTVSWGERVSVPTHLLLFDNEMMDSLTPTFTFTTTDPQGQDLDYQFSYSTDNTFAGSSTTVNSQIDTGFINTTNGLETAPGPYSSGDTMSYTVQSALTDTLTYWWRVRAKDPLGGNSYSFWSDPWSFTASSTATTSTWHQTTQEQFDTDSMTGLVASVSDSVSTIPAAVTTYDLVGINNGSLTHVARDFEVAVSDPTDPPTNNDINSLTTSGTSAGDPNLRSGIAGYASDAEASSGQYNLIEASDNSRWTTTDPGNGDDAVFWVKFHIDEDPTNISQLDLLLEGYQDPTPAGTDKAWFGIWRPGTTTPYWQLLEASQQNSDYNYTGTITTNIEEYFDGNNDIHLIFYNEDDSDGVVVDYVEAVVTSETATEGVITSSSFDFDDGNGPAWGELRWVDSEPGASSITYQVEYLNEIDEWELISDVVLSGNAAGFSSSPVDLQSLNTTTYNELRLIGNVTCDGATCPTLLDWTVEWSRGFTVSGTAFEYDGTSSTTAGTVRVAVEGVDQGITATISPTGYWTLENVTFFAGDTVTVYVDTAVSTDKAVGVTVYDGTPDISGMVLRKNHLTIGSDDNATVTNTEIEEYDFTSNVANIFFDVDGLNDLDVCAASGCEAAGFVVLPNNTYAPASGDTLLTHDMQIDGTLILTDNTIRVNGSWDNNATTSMGASTVVMTATSTTESIDSTGASSNAFNNLTLGETSGTATWNASSSLNIDGDLTVAYGTIQRFTEAITIADELTTGAAGYWSGIGTTTFDGADVSTWTDSNGTQQNIGNVVVDGTSHILLLGSDVTAQSITVASGNTLDLSTGALSLSVVDDWINNGTLQAQNGEVNFISTASGNVITNGSESFYDITFDGVGGDWSFTDSILNVDNDLTVATGTVTMPTATTTIDGSFTNSGGTFVHNNSIIEFTGAGTETITTNGTIFNNAFYDVLFSGVGNWTFLDTNATTSNNISITGGTVILPSGILAVGGSLLNTAGAITPNGGTVQMESVASETIALNGSSLFNLETVGSGTYTFVDTNASVLGDLLVTSGTVVFPSGVLSLGGSLTNADTITAGTGSVLFNSTDVGETVDFGNSDLYAVTFNSATGGWNVISDATTTDSTTLTAGTITVDPGTTLSVGGVFTNTLGGASTTWTGSTLSLENGAYAINTKGDLGDVYETLRLSATADVSVWNSDAVTVNVASGGSLYSQDHATIDGALYIYGDYTRTSGSEYWSYSTDFDGTDLSGGSERLAAVQFASGATANITDATFEVLGSSATSTTVANQGSGTYAINISAGTTTAQYYEMIDLGSTGVSLTNAVSVTSLDDGLFTVAAPGGSAITLSSTTIDANVGKQIYRVTFATTTAISAFNISQTDGTPASYWWFRESLGNLDGEALDNDTGDPGSVRWDDSSLTVAISGVVYADAGVTPLTAGTCSAGTPVRLVVEGGATYDQACTGGAGAFTFPAVAIVGDPTITVFLNGASGGERGTVVTKTVTAAVTNMDIYANRVIVRHEDVSPVTIADMAAYDSSDDVDVQFTAATGTSDVLTTFAQNELYVWATSTFTPGGSVTLSADSSGNVYDGSLYLAQGATFTGVGTTTYTIGGTFTQGTGATFVPASTSVLMNATTSGKAVTASAGEVIAFNQLTFNGTSGAWNINGDISATADIHVVSGTVTGTSDVTLSNGSFYGNGLVSFGGGTTTIETTNTLGGTQDWTFYDLTLGNGGVVGTTTLATSATTTVSRLFTIETGHFFDMGSAGLELSGSGSVFVEDGTFIESTGTVRYSGVAATDILATNYYNLDLNAAAGTPTYTATGIGISIANDLYVGGEATTIADFDTNDTVLNVDGDVKIQSNGTLIGSDSAAFTVAGSWDNDGTYTASGGSVILDGLGVHTIAAGSSDFASLTMLGTGAYTISEHATATEVFTLSSASAFTLTSGQNLAVGGTFTNNIGGAATTWTGTTLSLYGGGNYLVNPATTTDTYQTVLVGANTDVRMWNSDATTVTALSGGSLYSMDHGNVDGDLYIYGDYEKNVGSDYWSYVTDFDGSDLTGGSERLVDVYVEGGGSILYQAGGALSVLGVATASTTVQNQGSGVFSMDIGNTGSTTMLYYNLADMDSDGLTFSGSPDVTELSYGTFIVGSDSDSAITVAGSAITANPALTFTDNTFATSSGVTTAVNVTATGASVSSWRFTNHAGDIAGETFDVDPDGDPGYIVWDDSAASITVSGNVYSDEGSTASTACDGVTANVHLRIAGLTSYTTSCNGGTGAYSISSVAYSPGDSLIVYIDGEAEKAATVSEDPISNISNMDLYENRVIVRHEGADSLSIADMSVWDSSDDADIPFTAVDAGTDTLTLPVNTKLIVWNSKEFEPVGNVTLTAGGAGAAHDGAVQLFSNAQWTANGSELYSVAGSFVLDGGASFDAATSDITFTTTAAGRTIDINDGSFYDMNFTGSGSWSITDSILNANDVSITAGALTLPTGTTTVSGAFDNNGGTFTHNGSLMIFDGTTGGNIVRGDGSDFAEMQFTGSGSWTMNDVNATSTGSVTIAGGTLTLPSGVLAVGGGFNNTGGTVVHNTSEIKFTSNTAATLYANGSNLAGVHFAGTGPYTFIDTSLSLTENLTVSAGSVTLASGTLSIAGSFDASGGTFDNATGTILFNSNDIGETINPGMSDFYNVVFGNGSGGWTVASNATATNNFNLSSASVFTQQTGTTLSVGNVFTNLIGGAGTIWTGSTLILNGGSEYQINTKSLGGDSYNVLQIASDTDISMWNSQATSVIVDASGSVYSKDNNAVDGSLYIYGDYHIGTTTEYWSYATDFDGTDLTGGAERAVTVSIASNATTTVDGGVLNIVGVLGNETTVTNQSVGTYSFQVTDGTFNALYYAYRNLDINGLQFAGTPTISSLTEGDFELAVGTGSLITLASTTLDVNASMVITGVRFATTTAITGSNVTLLGTTANAWTFIGHTGNLDGEDYDSEGVGVCGSIRWDDSACLLTQQVHYRWRNDDGGIDVPDDEWFDADWNKRKRVRVENDDASTYTDAVVKVTVAYDSNMQAGFDDLRFTDSSGTTSVPFWIETFTTSATATVWVKVPSLPANDFATVFMYYNNAIATSSSSPSDTFVMADDFEDGNISEYSGDTGKFTVDATYAFGGSYGLDNTGSESLRAVNGIYDVTATTSQGEIIRYMQYVDTSGGGDEVCTMFAVQSAGNNYAVCTEQVPGADRISIAKDVIDVDTSGTVLASTTVTYATGWYEIEIDWQTTDDIGVTLSKDGSVVATTTVNDSSYTEGGVGFTYWFNSGGWDGITSRARVDTEPVIYFGAEQVDGGATWAAALDTAAGGFVTGDVARLRLLIENSGLQITSQEYQLEFAEQGVAPSCESVPGGSYVDVPPQASCGVSPVCMQSSSNVTDGESTTDLLTEANGTFTLGELTEDPSSSADPLTINQDEYTELEYVITPTAFVSDQNICFRATNLGTELDTYLRVAPLTVKFDPSFGTINFNLGADIALVAGATTTVYATSTVTDLNGYADLQIGSSTMYTTTAGAVCTADNNDCYIESTNSSCSFTDCAGNSCTLSCAADFYFHADATDTDGANQWWAFLEVEDAAGGYDFGTSPSVEVMTLRALEVNNSIDYGALAPSTDTGVTNASTTVQNLGNDAIDVQIVGDDLNDGYSSTIPAGQQIFATSTFNYSACVNCTALATTSINYEVDLAKPLVDSPAVADDIFWGIAIPFGAASNAHTGFNTFYAIGD